METYARFIPLGRAALQASTSSSRHAVVFGPSQTRCGNRPAFSRRRRCSRDPRRTWRVLPILFSAVRAGLHGRPHFSTI